MSHVNGFDSAAFPAWLEIVPLAFSLPHLPKEPKAEVCVQCYQLLHHPVQSIPCPAASPNPLRFRALRWAGWSPMREGGSVLRGALVQPVSLGNRVLVLARAKPVCAGVRCNPREELYGCCTAMVFGKATASHQWHLYHLDLAAKLAVSPNFGCAWAAQPHPCVSAPGCREP